ncbi:hypothetical protein ABT167_20845 [Streptomyces sp. NPDC001792]|uniref:hypothetical protein n=1 Tax=Streptomyces sp. NPDC001792 TaxID=3154524 RepID=UPI003321F044
MTAGQHLAHLAQRVVRRCHCRRNFVRDAHQEHALSGFIASGGTESLSNACCQLSGALPVSGNATHSFVGSPYGDNAVHVQVSAILKHAISSCSAPANVFNAYGGTRSTSDTDSGAHDRSPVHAEIVRGALMIG